MGALHEPDIRKEALMSAYVIVDIDIHDEPGLAEYRKLVPATVEKYGGRFAVREASSRRGRVPGSPSASSCWSSPVWTPLAAGTTHPSMHHSWPCDTRRPRPTW